MVGLQLPLHSLSALDWSGCASVIEVSPADMVATVQGGISPDALNAELGRHGVCLPIRSPKPLAELYLSGVAHPHEAEFGSWREWVLGLRALLADGTVFKSGSKAVKNVAGFDLHRFLVGSRGTLAIPFEFSLRIRPASALAGVRAIAEADKVQRVRLSDFAAARAALGARILDAEEAMGTLWVASTEPVPRWPHDWVAPDDPPAEQTMEILRRAKALFDPSGQLMPGEFGL